MQRRFAELPPVDNGGGLGTEQWERLARTLDKLDERLDRRMARQERAVETLRSTALGVGQVASQGWRAARPPPPMPKPLSLPQGLLGSAVVTDSRGGAKLPPPAGTGAAPPLGRDVYPAGHHSGGGGWGLANGHGGQGGIFPPMMESSFAEAQFLPPWLDEGGEQHAAPAGGRWGAAGAGVSGEGAAGWAASSGRPRVLVPPLPLGGGGGHLPAVPNAPGRQSQQQHGVLSSAPLPGAGRPESLRATKEELDMAFPALAGVSWAKRPGA